MKKSKTNQTFSSPPPSSSSSPPLHSKLDEVAQLGPLRHRLHNALPVPDKPQPLLSRHLFTVRVEVQVEAAGSKGARPSPAVPPPALYPREAPPVRLDNLSPGLVRRRPGGAGRDEPSRGAAERTRAERGGDVDGVARLLLLLLRFALPRPPARASCGCTAGRTRAHTLREGRTCRSEGLHPSLQSTRSRQIAHSTSADAATSAQPRRSSLALGGVRGSQAGIGRVQSPAAAGRAGVAVERWQRSPREQVPEAVHCPQRPPSVEVFEVFSLLLLLMLRRRRRRRRREGAKRRRKVQNSETAPRRRR